MKKRICLCVLLSAVFALCACTPVSNPQSTDDSTMSPTQMADATASQPISPSDTPAPPQLTAAPATGPSLYSSYAHMVSYDPAVGTADFDYFTMLRGDDAVAWLVDNEGYSLADAQSLVDDFADSEFIEKNTSSAIRTINLIDVPLKLMYHPDGTPLPGAEPIDADLADLFDLYHVDPDLVLHAFFWHVTVENGVVVSVEQVYWP